MDRLLRTLLEEPRRILFARETMHRVALETDLDALKLACVLHLLLVLSAQSKALPLKVDSDHRIYA